MASQGKRRRRRVNRPVAVTAAIAVGLAGAIAGAGTLAARATTSGRHQTATAAASADLSADAAQASPPPTATPSAEAPGEVPGTTDPAPRSVTIPSTGTDHTGEKATLYRGDGSTDTAQAGDEADRVGALFAGSIAAGHHSCTASVIHSDSRDLILTAAHCVSGASGLHFVPGYRDGKAPHGSWQVLKVFTTEGWDEDGDADQDYAVLQVAPLGGREIEDVVGGNTLGLDASATTRVRLYGYPDESEAPILCANATTRQSAHQRRIDCPSFPGGTSGGPWIDATDGRVIGVIGGYQQGGDSDDTSYSATFDKTVGDLYRRAVAAAAPPAPAAASPAATPAG
ncbi:trypsin-like serine peptidase [Kitasatospora sp. NPDC088346]|uniref:trypsin-like serine peptidase n=1 Tax=Kitasatospora sp. NPDC088346 TaxID=3364073 RepID=UPI00382F4ACA